MPFRRPWRRALSVLALLAILFSQLAVAAYACPNMAPAMAQMEEGVEAMPCCAEPDPEAPQLCWQHYQAGKQSADRPDAPTVSAVVAILHVMPAPPLATPPAAAPGTFHPPALERRVEPPASIRNCCFRT
jgi:hypothetical protein